jgi:hypothetical protein
MWLASIRRQVSVGKMFVLARSKDCGQPHFEAIRSALPFDAKATGLGKKEAMRKLVISVLTMLGVAALGSPAQAVVPGANARIVFTPGRCFRVRS